MTERTDNCAIGEKVVSIPSRDRVSIGESKSRTCNGSGACIVRNLQNNGAAIGWRCQSERSPIDALLQVPVRFVQRRCAARNRSQIVDCCGEASREYVRRVSLQRIDIVSLNVAANRHAEVCPRGRFIVQRVEVIRRRQEARGIDRCVLPARAVVDAHHVG